MMKTLLFLGLLSFTFFSLSAQETDTVSSDTVEISLKLSFYPNPAQNELSVTNNLGEAVEMKLFNILGESIFEQTVSKVETKIDLSRFPSGIYIVAFYYGDDTITQRLVKE